MNSQWEKELRSFFDIRSEEVGKERVTLETLCYVSGRDPRLWEDQDLYEDMIQSIKELLELDANHSLLEVGCATGFLALGLSKIVRHYTGVDLSKRAVQVASTLNLRNTSFQKANGEHLPFPDNHFDRSLCYDVVTNFPDFLYIKPIIREMIRVIKPFGKVMIGSVPDEEKKGGFQGLVQKVGAQLEESFGTIKNPVSRGSFSTSLRKWYLKKFKKIEPQIVCYYFSKSDFIKLGKELYLKTEIFDIHKKNPYYGYRFNVVYTKTS